MDTLTKSFSPTTVITANGEMHTHEEAIVYVKELDILLTMKVLDNTPAVLSLGKLCDENGYSYEWINGQKPHLIKDGIRMICNTENFVPIVVPSLSSSSSASSSTSRTPTKQESHSSSPSSPSPSSPTVGEMSVREKEVAPNSDISPVPVSELVDDRTVEPMKFHCKEALPPVLLMKLLESRLQRDVRIWVSTVLILISLKTEIARSVNGPKLQGPCRTRNGEAVPRAVNFGDLITADHRVLSDHCEFETIIDTQSWCRN